MGKRKDRIPGYCRMEWEWGGDRVKAEERLCELLKKNGLLGGIDYPYPYSKLPYLLLKASRKG